jgi:hypothetical protein
MGSPLFRLVDDTELIDTVRQRLSLVSRSVSYLENLP